MIHLILKKIKKGSGEVFGFVCIAPALVLVVGLMVTILQLTTLREKLEYATYTAARAAVVSPTLESAQENAKRTAELNLGSVGDSIDKESMKVNLKVIEGPRPSTAMGDLHSTTVVGGASVDTYSLHENTTTGWVKGNYLECEIEVNAKPVVSLLTGDDAKKKCKMTMLIEISE